MTRYIILISALLILASCGGAGDGLSEDNATQGRRIVETGELAAIKFESFYARRLGGNSEMKIVGILDQGELVKPGDSLIQFDATTIQREIVDMETQLETQMASLEKIQFDMENRDNEIAAAIKSEEATFAMSKLELEASRYEPELRRRINELRFKQSEINRAKEQKRREYNKTLGDYDYRIQELRVEQLKNRIKNAYDMLPQLTIRTNTGGVFQRGDNRRIWPHVPLKVGDAVYAGNLVASVPDLSYMKVNTVINEADFTKIEVGQKAAVRMDALPNVVFNGEITYIGKLCHQKEGNTKQKVFDVEINLLDSDERLKPGMTVSCEYLLK